MDHTKNLFEEAMTLNLARKIRKIFLMCLIFLYVLIHVLKFQNLAVKAFDVLIFFFKGFNIYVLCAYFLN